MLWLLLTALAIILGAELNSELERQTARDTTAGDERPLGQRGAYATDTIGPSIESDYGGIHLTGPAQVTRDELRHHDQDLRRVGPLEWIAPSD